MTQVTQATRDTHTTRKHVLDKLQEHIHAARARDPQDVKLQVRKRLLKSHLTEAELADEVGGGVKQIRAALAELQADGANLRLVHGNKWLLHALLEQGGSLELKAARDGWTVLGFITDNHHCSKFHRQDVEVAAYDQFERDGITTVLNAGNWIDGEARFNKNELTVFGMDAQIDHWIEMTPVKKGITTYFIAGDDHEGWYAQRECINIGQYAQMRAEKAGRFDLKYLGYMEADVRLCKGTKAAVLRLMHPGGGSSYAFSYAPQKIVEAFQGGEKPDLLMIGHYHKYDVCYPREVPVVSGGCVCDQTSFMRKKKLAAHVGFMEVAVQQDSADGHITRLRHEFFPFYDRGYYERRFE